MCNGKCNQGRACVCAPMQTKCGGQRIDTERMRQTGVIQGPYKRTRPITLAWSERIRRAVVAWWGRHVMDPKVQD